MGGHIPFTDNYRDLGNEKGFQFEFVCERCGNGYRSEFVTNKRELGKGLLRGAGSLLGGRLAELSNAAETFDRSTNSPAKDKALEEAVEEISKEFHQCRGCGNWVCDPVCWNKEIGQCLNCSPSIAEELARAQASTQVEQMREKVKTVDYTADLDVTTRTKVTCPHCDAKVDGGKFCPACGQALAATTFCSNCGGSLKPGAKFCAECGQKT